MNGDADLIMELAQNIIDEDYAYGSLGDKAKLIKMLAKRLKEGKG
jgi:hypothetical protein